MMSPDRRVASFFSFIVIILFFSLMVAAFAYPSTGIAAQQADIERIQEEKRYQEIWLAEDRRLNSFAQEPDEEPVLMVTAWIERHSVAAVLNTDRHCPDQFNLDESGIICLSKQKYWHQVPIYFAGEQWIDELCQSEDAWACYTSNPAGAVIYIQGGVAHRGTIGCSVLYHEILHGMWIGHDTMREHYGDCSVKGR